ncbi:hypothetical protein PRZ48_013276 [Zasmidium cellare]|uniref:C2H2-type domain-containing protein n=1 Tax=Zasmidium cellare TaxID=395010 RepID=A0ABR0E3L3_ZASCE|nr:hypothetical protein PRZ48_013276 [Zasmidium cellare]
MASQPMAGIRKRCTEEGCRVSFKRSSDLERHRKGVHRRRPALGDGCKSAVPIIEPDPANCPSRTTSDATDRSTNTACQGSITGAISLCVDDVDDQTDVATIADSGIGFMDPSQLGVQPSSHSSTSTGNGNCRSTHHTTVETDGCTSYKLVTLVQKVQTKQRIAHRLWQLLNPSDIEPKTECDDCDAPLDAGEQSSSGQHGDWKHFTTSGNGFGKGKRPEKGGQPSDRWDKERDHRQQPECEPDGASDKQAAQLPCVCHRFNGPGHDPFPDCSTRKSYMSGLRVHHYRHQIFICWTCFESFPSGEALEAHRTGIGCRRFLCVTPGCTNYNDFSSPESPCNNHGNYIQPKLLWRMLYRKAHGLSLQAWVPDPHREVQQVPPGLPADHYMAAYSQPLPGTDPDPFFIDPALQQAGHEFGGGMYGEQFNQPAGPAGSPELNFLTSSVPLPALESLLANLWDCVNNPYPTWTPFMARMFDAGVRPLDQQPRIEVAQGVDQRTAMLEVLAHEYASLLTNPHARTLRQWASVARMTRGLLGNEVQVPNECPWYSPDGTMPSFAGPSQNQQPPQPPAANNMIDPFALFTNNNNPAYDTSLPANMYQNHESIPQFVIQSTNPMNPMFLAVPQAPNDAPTEPSHDRRASLASMTSPSDAMYNSAPPSFIFTPSPDGVGGTGFQQTGTPTPSRQQYMENGEVDERCVEPMEDIDWTNNLGL